MRKLIAASLFAGWLVAVAAGARAEQPIDYLKEIKPIFASRCFACHGALKQESGLRLDASFRIRQGGESGPAIVAGKAAESRLVEKITADEDSRMPPEGEPLNPAQIALLKAWIDQGAKAPDEALPPDPRDHWSFRPPLAAAIPSAAPLLPPVNPIDAFLDHEHEQRRGLRPLPPAEKHVLLRRVYLDLIGLPPTREELHAFLADPSPTAYETVVDRLLASPQYGERWGRHWMDIWRYTDPFGLGKEWRNSQRHIWHWRDWIIESLNTDKPYDRMIQEMLAADELAPDDPKTLRALGFVARNYFLFNRNVWLDNLVEHTGRGFLGLTMQCTRCHDHKYDPISQKDYYRLRAVFEPHNVRTDRLPGEADLLKDGLPRIYDDKLDAQTFLFVRGAQEHPDNEHPLAPGVPAVLADSSFEISPVKLPLTAYYPDMRPFVQAEMIAAADAVKKQAESALADARRQAASPPDAVSASTPAIGDVYRRAEQNRRVAAQEKRLEHLTAELQALRDRVSAENAKYAEPVDPRARALARIANESERRANLLKAERNVLELEQRLAVATEAIERAAEETRNTVSQTVTDLAAAQSARTCAIKPQLDVTKPIAGAQPGNAAASENPVAAAAHKREAELAAANKALADARKQLGKATAAAVQPGDTYAPLGTIYPSTSSGRRLALARWITNRQNPLTARVAVNHIWTRHFGEPLAGSMFDFGLRTKPPDVQPLLDWLAVDFMDSGWSMKRLHRLIVTSNAYRRSSGGEAGNPNSKLDQDNHYYWRMNTKRMEAEIVRDSLLAVSESLDPAMGGHELPVDTADTTSRRTLYYRYARDDQIKFLSMFDGPSVEECYRRQSTIVPQQALVLVNGKMALSASVRLAAVISREIGGGEPAQINRAFVASAFERILGRLPSDAERSECEQTLARLEAVFRARNKPGESPQQKARENLVHVLVNHNDFVTIR